MSERSDCVNERLKNCARNGQKKREECVEYRDEGYSECRRTRDDGYRDCCDWWPCSWLCKAWVWVSHIVCVVWTWIANVVCVALRIILDVICLLWVTVTIIVCWVSPNLMRWLDGLLELLSDLVGEIVKALLGIIDGAIYAITHPTETLETIADWFSGCPNWSMAHDIPVRVVAHHGYIKAFPENTAQSCHWAMRKGADALEIDLCITADDQVVLWHDWDPDDAVSLIRQTGNPAGMAYYPDAPPVGSEWRRPVGELTLAELRGHYAYRNREDAAAKVRHDIDYGDRDLGIPTLPEFVEAMEDVHGWGGLKLLCLDVKVPASGKAFAARLTDEIHSALPARHPYAVVVMVPSYAVLVAMKARSDERSYGLTFTWDIEFPPIFSINPLRYSAVDHAVSAELHNSAASVGRPVASVGGWLAYKRVIGHDLKRANAVNHDPGALNAGRRIDHLIAWTVNEDDELRCLVRANVSAVITDEIELARQIVGP